MPYREGNTFPPVCRLHSRKEYDLVRKQGHKRHTQHFLVVLREKSSGPTRLGLTVSRKIGGAVARNRVKRRLREFFRLHYRSLPRSVDLVIVAKSGAANLTYQQVCMELHAVANGASIPRTSSWPKNSSLG